MGSDGKDEGSGMKDPGFNPWLRQEKLKESFVSLFLAGGFGTYSIYLKCYKVIRIKPYN